MAGKLYPVRCFFLLLFSFSWAGVWLQGQAAQPTLAPAQAQALVERALATESPRRPGPEPREPSLALPAAQDQPAADLDQGDCLKPAMAMWARLLSIDDQPLSPAGEQQEQARLQALVDNPGLHSTANRARTAIRHGP